MTNAKGNEWYDYIIPTLTANCTFYNKNGRKLNYDTTISEDDFGDEYFDVIEYIKVNQPIPKDVSDYIHSLGIGIPAEVGYYSFDLVEDDDGDIDWAWVEVSDND